MTILILLSGVLFVISVLARSSVGGRYGTPADDPGPAEREWVRLRICWPSWLRGLSCSYGWRAVEAELEEREAGVRFAVRRRLARVDLRRFLSEFAWRSGLVEEDPARSVRELPALRSVLEESLEAYDEVLGMLRGGRQGVGGRKR